MLFFSDAAENISDLFLLTVLFSKIIELSYATRVKAHLTFVLVSALDLSENYLCSSTVFPVPTTPSAAVSWPSAHSPAGLVTLFLETYDLLLKKKRNLL